MCAHMQNHAIIKLLNGGAKMPIRESQKQSAYKYKEKNIKRVPLDMQKSDYEQLAAAARAVGQSVNGYIKQAIAEKMART